MLRPYRFSDLYEMSSGISTSPEQAGHGAPFCSFTTVFNNYFVPSELPDRMDTSATEQQTYSIMEGDILLTRTSETLDELGMSCVATKAYPGATFSGFLKRLRPTQDDITYHKFMAFYLRSPIFRKTMDNNAVMTLRCSLNEEIFSYLELLLPSYDEQVVIGNFLYEIHQKIELNKRISKELEGFARLVYQCWFIQYDFPITAKRAADMGDSELDGAPYRLSGGKMVYNEALKTDIPECFRVVALSDIATIIMGQSPPGGTYNLRRNGQLFFQGSTDFGWRFPSARQYTTKATRIAEEGDILLSVRAPVGTLNIAPSRCAIGRGLSALRSKTGHSSYLLNVMEYFHQIFERRNKDGTTFGAINKDDLHSLQVAQPPDELVASFENLIGVFDAMIFVRHQQTVSLVQTRDWLVPMLMNGQVRVR